MKDYVKYALAVEDDSQEQQLTEFDEKVVAFHRALETFGIGIENNVSSLFMTNWVIASEGEGG